MQPNKHSQILWSIDRAEQAFHLQRIFVNQNRVGDGRFPAATLTASVFSSVLSTPLRKKVDVFPAPQETLTSFTLNGFRQQGSGGDLWDLLRPIAHRPGVCRGMFDFGFCSGEQLL